MNSFSRAYRDPNSPLTPLTPLASNTAFSFNFGGDDTLKPYMDSIEARRSKANQSSWSGAGQASGIRSTNQSKYNRHKSAKDSSKHSPRYGSKSVLSTNSSATPRSNLTNSSISTSSLWPKYETGNVCNDSPSMSSGRSSSSVNATTILRGRGNYSESSTLSSSRASSRANSTRHETPTNSGVARLRCDRNSRTSSSYLSSGNHATFVNNSNLLSSTKLSGSSACCSGNDYMVDDARSPILSVFNWVWDRLSPFKNPTPYQILVGVGMQKYWDIFEREEIVDLDVFSTLTMTDLEAIGIKDVDDCVIILKAVGIAIKFISRMLANKRQ